MTRLRVGQAIAGLAAAIALPLATLLTLAGSAAPAADASSHREAPLIAQDPAADNTDVYAFTSPEGNGTVTLVANYYPLQEPNAGPNFYRFDDDVLYAIKVDNNGDNLADISFEFRFRTETRNPNTFLYNTGPVTSLDDDDLNVRQFYTVTRIDRSGRREIGTNVPVPPVNIGPKSTPNYEQLSVTAVRPLTTGGQVFAGQRDDPFFVDTGALFDLLTIRKPPGNAGGGIDGLANHNVQSIVIQLPTALLSANGQPIAAGDLGNANAVIGVWANASRQRTRVLNEGGTETESGEWIQVSRLGMPLVNEVVIPLRLKDAFNSINPDQDVAAGALPLVQDPEPARLLRALYGINVPPAPRTDLVAVFLTGIPGSVLGLPGATAPMNRPSGASTASEMMRLNMGTPATRIGEGNRFGVLGGDVRGFPNGRRLEDDVVDIELRALAGATFSLTNPGYTPPPEASLLGDGVDRNDATFLASFPYLATPRQGFDYLVSTPFSFVRCGSGRVYELNDEGSQGQLVRDPRAIDELLILQASSTVPSAVIASICITDR